MTATDDLSDVRMANVLWNLLMSSVHFQNDEDVPMETTRGIRV